jgi:hypothetical protein
MLFNEIYMITGLPPDTLAGHRERFLKQFQDLRQFYLNANTMQYFRNLIQIPLLPEVSVLNRHSLHFSSNSLSSYILLDE